MKITLKGLLAAPLLSLSLGFLALHWPRHRAINVNTADAELLAELPGIGPSRAPRL